MQRRSALHVSDAVEYREHAKHEQQHGAREREVVDDGEAQQTLVYFLSDGAPNTYVRVMSEM